MADGLRRLDGVAEVEVDLQANVCTVTPTRDRLPDLAGFARAVRAAGYRPERVWLAARGTLAARDGAVWLTIAGSDVVLRWEGPSDAGPPFTGRLELDGVATLRAETAPR